VEQHELGEGGRESQEKVSWKVAGQYSTIELVVQYNYDISVLN
jgi:hypothetical protein